MSGTNIISQKRLPFQKRKKKRNKKLWQEKKLYPIVMSHTARKSTMYRVVTT